MTATQWLVIVGIATVAVSALAILAGLKSVRNQLRLTVFLEYTGRYAKIMDNMPYKAREPGSGYRLASQSDEERCRVLAVFREYLNLCSEEHWLHDQKRIDDPTWKIWERGMQDTACFPPFREAWSYLAPEYDAYKDFQAFVNRTMLSRAEGSEENVSRRQPPPSGVSVQNQQSISSVD